jgi:hypothetical protein
MQQSQTDSGTEQSDDHQTLQTYLPGMPQVSAEPSRVERFLKRVFRRRGEFGVRVRRE